ncbi:hypothetical protein WME89_49635 [Sorangium sp. So ce321]|uniref:hypothetical protein n=1 Tax=Sorangium sp. So ce321 TaxID=3133300 RepID=UPI003F5DA649
MVELVSPDAGRTEWRYDLVGNLRAKQTAELALRGQLIRYEYDYSAEVESARHFDSAKVDRYAEAMRKGTWDWSADKIIVDRSGSIISGHHRVLAAERAGVNIPENAIHRLNTVTPRPVYDWADIVGH